MLLYRRPLLSNIMAEGPLGSIEKTKEFESSPASVFGVKAEVVVPAVTFPAFRSVLVSDNDLGLSVIVGISRFDLSIVPASFGNDDFIRK